MARLPQPGGDKGTWGAVLNDFLAVEHNADGTLKASATLAAFAPLANPTFTGNVTVPTPTSITDAVTKQYVDNLVAAGAPDATASDKGIIQLAGHLTGTAANPQIANSAITDTQVAAGAEIAQSKIAGLSTALSGKVNTTTTVNGVALAGNITLDPDDLDDSSTTNKFITSAEKTKLSNATTNADTDISGNTWVLDEDNMVSNSDEKVPTQQSTKAYVDNASTAAIATLPEWQDGVGTKIDIGTPGFISVDSSAIGLSSANAVGSTTSETSLLSTPSMVAANTLVAGKTVIHIEVGGQLTNNTGSDADITLRLKIGGVTWKAITISSIPSSAAVRAWQLSGTLTLADLFGSKVLMGPIRLSVGDAGTGSDFASYTSQSNLAAGTIDVSLASAIDITTQMSTASSSLSTHLIVGFVRLLTI